MRPHLLVASATVLVLALPGSLLAAPKELGGEILLNTDTQSQQHNPVAAYDAAGNALVVWANDHDGLRARYVSTSGALGTEIPLVANRNLTSYSGRVVFRKDPTVVIAPNGNFLVAWTEERDFEEASPLFENLQLLGREVFAQAFQANGTPIGTPVQLSETTGFNSVPKAVLRRNGDIFVAWEASSQNPTPQAGVDGVFGRLLSTSGKPTTDQFEVSGTEIAHDVALAHDPISARTLVLWNGSASSVSGSAVEVHGRLFAGNGQPLGDDILISTGNANQQGRPAVAATSNGMFMTVWQENSQDIYHSRIDGQLVGNAGNLVGPEFKLHGYGNAQISPSIATTTTGNFLVIWMEYNTWFPTGLYAEEIDHMGNLIGSPFWVNDKQVGAKLETAMASNGNGTFVIPYESFYSGNNLGIVARLISAK